MGRIFSKGVPLKENHDENSFLGYKDYFNFDNIKSIFNGIKNERVKTEKRKENDTFENKNEHVKDAIQEKNLNPFPPTVTSPGLSEPSDNSDVNQYSKLKTTFPNDNIEGESTKSRNVDSKEDINVKSGSKDCSDKRSLKKSLLKAPPPSVEEGNVLVQRIIPVGKHQDLISYSKTSPSKSFYVTPAHVTDAGLGERLPPYRYITNDMLQGSQQLPDVDEDAGPQEWSMITPKDEPTLGKSDFIPGANWLDVDYKYAQYFEKDDEFENRPKRRKFNFEDYNAYSPEQEKIFIDILETIDETPNLGVDPNTFNAYWLKETILRMLERSGKYATKYYDKEGNEYSLRSSKPIYSVKEWAMKYLSTVKPPHAQEQRYGDYDGGLLFQQVDKRMSKKKRSLHDIKSKVTNSSTIVPEKGTIINNTTYDTNNIKKTTNSRAKNITDNKFEMQTNLRKKLNLIPEEQQEGIYDMLMTKGGPGRVLKTILTPQNQKTIFEELAKPTPDEYQDITTEEISSDCGSKNMVGPDLEKVYEILLGDNMQEKKAIYEMMKTPVSRERVYEALCRIGDEKYPEFYTSCSENEDIYPGSLSQNDKKKERLRIIKESKKGPRPIVIQTHPFPHETTGDDMTLDDPDDIEHDPQKQQEVFDILKMSDELNYPSEVLSKSLSTSKVPPSSKAVQTSYRKIDEILAKIDDKGVIYDMLKTSDGRQKVFEALCNIGKIQNSNYYEPLER